MTIDRWTIEVVSGKKEVKGRKLGRPTGSCTKQQILHDNEAEVLRMLEAGTSIRAICRHFHVSKDTWYRYRCQKNPDTCP